MTSGVLMCLSSLGALAMLTLGILSLARFAKTRRRRFLVCGILLTFVVPGILGLIAAKVFYERVYPHLIVYAPFNR